MLAALIGSHKQLEIKRRCYRFHIRNGFARLALLKLAGSRSYQASIDGNPITTIAVMRVALVEAPASASSIAQRWVGVALAGPSWLD